MKLPPRWARLLLIGPLWVPASLLIVVAFGLLAGVGALTPPHFRRGRFPRFAALVAAYAFLDLCLLLASTALWCRYPLRRRRPPRWVALHVAVLRWALNRLVSVAHRTVGYRIAIEEELPLDSEDPVVLLARHAGPGDSFSLVWLIVERYRRCPRVVMKDTLQWDPGLDVILNRLKTCFLPSHTGAGDDATDLVAQTARSLASGEALLLFPEGGNWTPSRHRRAVTRLQRTGKRRAARQAAAHPNVLPPRPAGTAACLRARPDLDAILIAHTGLDRLVNPLQIWRALPLEATPMRIGVRRVAADQVPRGEEEIHRWLDSQWADLSNWVSSRAPH